MLAEVSALREVLAQQPIGVLDLAAVAAALNGRPRKTLAWKIPTETLEELLRSGQHDSVATTP